MEVQFGRNGTYDPSSASPITVTDHIHRMRSDAAEEATMRATAARPLPGPASNGGCVGADPTSKEESILSKGPAPEPSMSRDCETI